MNGLVNKREPKVWVKIKDRNGREIVEEALLDTGFTRTVSIPKFYIDTELIPLNRADIERRYSLGDGSAAINTTYEGQMLYPDGVWRPCLIDSLSDEVIVGMEYLKGFLLVMECDDKKVFWVGKKSFLPALRLKYLPRGR